MDGGESTRHLSKYLAANLGYRDTDRHDLLEYNSNINQGLLNDV